MCLSLRLDDPPKIKWNKKREAIVFKEMMFRGDCYRTTFQGVKYPLSGMMLSNREDKELDPSERRYNVVNKGLHFYLDPKNAKRYANRYGTVVVWFRVKEEDLVGAGTFDSCPSAVFMKAEIGKIMFQGDLPR